MYKNIFLCLICFPGFLTILPTTVSARPVKAWSYAELEKSSTLIAIAIPEATRQTGLMEKVNGVTTVTSDGTEHATVFPLIETKFRVLAKLKGDLPSDELLVRHFINDSIAFNSPSLIAFDPKLDKQYLLFLKSGTDGDFRFVSNDPDEAFSVSEVLQGSLWFRYVKEKMKDHKRDNK